MKLLIKWLILYKWIKYNKKAPIKNRGLANLYKVLVYFSITTFIVFTLSPLDILTKYNPEYTSSTSK